MSLRIAVTGRIPSAGIEMLEEAGEVVAWDSLEVPTVEQVHAMVKGADAVLTLLTTKVDDAFLDAAGPQLKVVANVAVGYNNLDVAACARRGVVCTNTPGVLTDATADIAMALILMTTRRLGEGERVIRSQQPWQWGMFYMLGSGIQGNQLGIVGMGDIGQGLARRAKAFGMKIAYSNRRPVAPQLEAELDAQFMSMEELLSTSDVVSLNCPYSAATHHLMSTAEFEMMRDSAFLINTARGPIVDEVALVTALKTGQIAGAGLDVFENEPAVHPGLLECDNAVVIPHLGSATQETRAAMARLAAHNAVNVLAGVEPPTPIPVG
ncbi:MAG TPA: D-glycerate dehydrogenase [Ilumatobacteraceae bacterium]|nr:D-glycerate dehydrogenase [Ilumatobacteraceae bacterium]